MGLKEWIRSALEPVQDGYLYPGHHPTPKRPGGGPSPKQAAALSFNIFENIFQQFDTNAFELEAAKKTIADQISQIRKDLVN